MKIPKRFRFNGHTVQVQIISPEEWPHGDGVVGCLDPDQMSIDLRSDLAPSVRHQKFLHEVMHLVLLPINPRLANDEWFVEQLSQALNQLNMTVGGE